MARLIVTATSLSRRQLAALGALALLPRVLNLGSFSLWLDEVIETEQAGGSLGRLLAELRHDAVHPPLEGLLTWTLLHLGLSETARRLVPVALGIATVLLLAGWVGRHFGERAGLAVGAVAALSPVGVHYSQELRPYALALFLMVAALVLLDRLLGGSDETPGTSSGFASADESPGTSSASSRPDDTPGADESPGTSSQSPGTRLGPLLGGRAAWRLGLLFAAVLGCFYTLYLSALVLVPLGWLLLEAAFGP
ncbi:MAG TPA: glycosyltransferase family 39 protein, partial [Thermoanaerobaculia bacterium]